MDPELTVGEQADQVTAEVGASIDPSTSASPGSGVPPHRSSRMRNSWRSILFAPVGDGQRRRRGSDGFRVGICLLVVLLCWLATQINSSAERAVIGAVTPAPDGVRWLVTSVWWGGSLGLIAIIVILALVSRQWAVVRDCVLAGVGAWLVCVVLGALLGANGGRPVSGAPLGFAEAFPVARVAATVAVAGAALPYLSRWVQRMIRATIGLLAVATVVSLAGLPVAVLASLATGVLLTSVVHLVFGSPLGLLSATDVAALVGDLGFLAADIVPAVRQEWGVSRFEGTMDGGRIAVDVYGRDASDAQLMAKTARFLLYRDSGPTLALTRRQQVEHEAYLTLLADRAGANVSRVVAAGPAGPARDALLITSPPRGRTLAEMPQFVMPADPAANELATVAAVPINHCAASTEFSTVVLPSPSAASQDESVLSDAALDAIFEQVLSLRTAGIAHGGFSTETILVDDADRCGLIDMRAASTVARSEQLDRDLAGALAATALIVGPERAIAAAARVLTTEVLAAALPFLQRAALNPVASRAMRSKKALLTALRRDGATAAGVEVPELIEPRRVSWINLALVVGTVIGGWALLGVLVNVTKSSSTITGADWVWVGIVFVLAQAVYPALAVTTLGSVTDTLSYGRTVALEVANTFVSLAVPMGALATRVRFFQQQGYDGTLAVSSGVLISTASWIVKGGLFLIALPIALSQFHFGAPQDTGGGSGESTANLVWLIVAVVVAVGVVLGLLFVVPRWRRLASAKLRPKASEMWTHLKLLSTHPRNLVEIFGGEIVGQLLIALSLGAALHAFGQQLGLAALLIVLTLGSMLGGISPVPGGMGVVEAGMILGLTAAGIPESQAVAAVFVQRLFTAYLPPIWGWFCLMWMRKKEYL